MWTSTLRSGELVISGLLFCVGLFTILCSLTMPHGDYSVPGPGFFPALLGILLCGVSLGLIIQSFLRRTPGAVKIGHRYIWSAFIAMTVLAFLFERLGFILAMAVFVGFLLKMLSDLRWVACILLAVAAAITAYVFFGLLIGLQLPSGSWL